MRVGYILREKKSKANSFTLGRFHQTLKKNIFGVPHLATSCIFLISTMNHNWVQELCLACLWPHSHLVYWMQQDLNPQPFDRESSFLTTRLVWRPTKLCSQSSNVHIWQKNQLNFTNIWATNSNFLKKLFAKLIYSSTICQMPFEKKVFHNVYTNVDEILVKSVSCFSLFKRSGHVSFWKMQRS